MADSDLAERIARCAGATDDQIAEAFAGLELDDVTRHVLEQFAARTHLGTLPALPYTVRHVLYGDVDVSEWTMTHTPDGITITDAEPDDVDLHVRWERWEDTVRLLNGDVTTLTLLYARRLVCGGGDLALDETVGAITEPPWCLAVDFAPNSPLADYHRVLAGVIAAKADGKQTLADYVERVGMTSITEARGVVIGQSLVDAGAAEELEGSYMRMQVPADPPVDVNIAFAPGTARTAAEIYTPPGPPPDPDGGVTLPYASSDALLAACTGEMTFDQLLVNGLVEIHGSPERTQRFGIALMKLAALYGRG